jgi:hypothetical protein
LSALEPTRPRLTGCHRISTPAQQSQPAVRKTKSQV